jgi:hypothetical protein
MNYLSSGVGEEESAITFAAPLEKTETFFTS